MNDGEDEMPTAVCPIALPEAADPAEAIELARLVAVQLARLSADDKNILCIRTAMAMSLLEEVGENWLAHASSSKTTPR
jgi:hypothetical protein